MKITVSNQIKIEDPPDILKHTLVEMLKHSNPPFVEATKLGKSTYNIPEHIYGFSFDAANNMYVPRGIRGQLIELINSYNLQTEFVDMRSLTHGLPYIDGSAIEYRPYQSPAINRLLSAGPEGVLVAPAGSGKTVMGMSLLPILMQRTLWLTHTDRLFKQSYERCMEFIPSITKEDIGNIGDSKWTVGNIITFGMIPTLVRNLDRVSELRDHFGLIILDEAHHCPASTFLKVIMLLNPYFMYGLTATPYRRDGLEDLMFQVLGPIRAEIAREEVARYKGTISPTIIYTPVSFGPRVEISNTAKILKNNVIFNVKRNLRIKDDVVREAEAGNFCIVASGRKAHCDVLYELIKKEWPRTGIATGKYSKKKVDAEVEAFNNNEITVLITTPELLGEGFDIDFLNRLFIATSFRTEARTEQLVGRIQRFHPNKKDALVYDYVDENIGVFTNQFYSKYKDCRSNVYQRLGLQVISYSDYFNN